MFRITILGTSGSAPTKERGLAGVAVEYEGMLYLLDCGEGTQRQMMRFGLNPYRINAIFITHMHGDHVIGVAGIVRTLALYKRTAPLYIYVPEGYAKGLLSLLQFDNAMLSYPIIVEEVRAGVVRTDRNLEIRAFALRHTVKTYGYVVRELDRHHFIKSKCDALGIKSEMFSALSKRGSIRIGKKTVRLGEVTTVELGRKIVYATDTRPAASTVTAAKDADLLIHESAYSDELAKLAKERLHSTAREAAGVAKRAHVKRLVLTHMSTRYTDPRVLEDEAKAIFKNVEAASDGMSIAIERNKRGP